MTRVRSLLIVFFFVMDGFDPFENHEKVIGAPKAQTDPFSWNDDNSGGDVLDPATGLSPGIYPSLPDGGSAEPNTGVDPYDSFRDLTVAPVSTSAVSSLPLENQESFDNQIDTGESFPQLQTFNQATDSTIPNSIIGDAIMTQNPASESLNSGEPVAAVPRIEVSDAPDAGPISSVGKKVNFI